MDYRRLSRFSGSHLRLFFSINDRQDCTRRLRWLSQNCQHHKLNTTRTGRLLQVLEDLGSEHRLVTRIRLELYRFQRKLSRLRLGLCADESDQRLGPPWPRRDASPLSNSWTCVVPCCSNWIGERVCSSRTTSSHRESLKGDGRNRRQSPAPASPYLLCRV